MTIKEMKTLVKWVGGKTRFLKYISEEIKSVKFRNYFEPFAGSAAVFLDIYENDKNHKYFINDLNKNLIDFYMWIKNDDPTRIKNTLDKRISGYIKLSEEQKSNKYYKWREEFNNLILKENLNKKEILEKASLFFIINKTSFNGIYRVNGSGGFNVPKGKYKTHYVPTIEQITEVKKAFCNTEITSMNWVESVKGASSGDIVYLDPPYYPDETSKFIGYTDPAFGVKEHTELVKEAKKLNDKGATIIISNSNSEQFRKLLNNEFQIKIKEIKIPTKRSINPLANDKEKFIEVLYIIKGEQNG